MVAPSPLSMICPSAAWSPNQTRTAVRYDFAFFDPLKYKTDEDPRKIHTSTKFYKKSLGNGRTGRQGAPAQALGTSVSIGSSSRSFGIPDHKASYSPSQK